MTTESMVIAGGGLAGATAAETLRSEGFDGPVVLIGSENHQPYLRPPLSKEYLQTGDAAVLPVLAENWYKEHDVELVTDSVSSLDPAASQVQLESGRSLRYHRLLLATGCSPRKLPIPGAELDGVHYLRTVEDSDRLHAALAGGGRRLVVVGSGWIGMEVAASASMLGNEVTVLGLEDVPLSGVLGPKLGTAFQNLHISHGVRFKLPGSAVEISGDGGKVTHVVTNDGSRIDADVMLIAIGVVPNTGLAEQAGLATGNGILVNESLQTSDPNIYAAGDVANAFHPVLQDRLRSEHWANAITGGKTAAKAMLGQTVQQNDIPYFYTDQFDLGMEYSGYGPLTPGADIVTRGSVESGEFIAFWLRHGKVVAGMNVNVWDVQDGIQELIRSARPVETTRLADPDVPLDEV
ncbi:NAD(P)/FAD-dependent oxidoreductase [Arthrobacter monumenti]